MSPLLACRIVATATKLTAVIGAVGPLICVEVPPNSAAKNPIKIARYNPDQAPKPDCNPNARAMVRATIPVVIPPSKSPLKFCNIVL